jgi:acyl-CoA synthetase (AMP-forming)/AMP-acid ligase II
MLAGRNFWELVEQRVAATPDALFCIDERDRSLSFAQYRAGAERAAAGLAARGIGRDSPVSWILPTTVEAALLYGALARLGAVQNPIIPIYRHKEVGFIARQSRARLLIVPRSYRRFDYGAMAQQIAGELPGLEVLVLDGPLPGGDVSRLPPPPEPTDVAAAPVRYLLYTSGTTSDPKGALHTDATLIATSRGLCGALQLSAADRVAMVFPITHMGGLVWMFCSMMVGITQLLVETFEAEKTVDFLARHGVTLAGAGTAFHLPYLEVQRKRGAAPIFPRVRAFPGGGAPKPPQLHYDLKRELGGAGIVSGYGLTECPIVANASPDDPDEKLAQTEGRPSPPEVQLKVVKLDGGLARPGEEGEIRALAPQCCRGYLDASLNAEAFDAEGYFRTGDLGYLDADGYVVITGRLKDVIIRSGENISAKEVEDALYRHPKVADVAVIGLPDPRTGERACAVVACKDPRDPLRSDEMVEFLKAQGMMLQKIPEQLEIAAEVPRNPSGKILKKELRDRYRDAPFARRA